MLFLNVIFVFTLALENYSFQVIEELKSYFVQEMQNDEKVTPTITAVKLAQNDCNLI